jgi:hypothetical protein
MQERKQVNELLYFKRHHRRMGGKEGGVYDMDGRAMRDEQEAASKKRQAPRYGERGVPWTWRLRVGACGGGTVHGGWWRLGRVYIEEVQSIGSRAMEGH